MVKGSALINVRLEENKTVIGEEQVRHLRASSRYTYAMDSLVLDLLGNQGGETLGTKYKKVWRQGITLAETSGSGKGFGGLSIN